MTQIKSISLVVFLIAVLFALGSVEAAIVYPVDDASVINTEPDTAHPDGNILTWTAYMSGGRGRSYIKFQTASLPPLSLVTAVTLNLYQYDAGGFVPWVSICNVSDDSWSQDTLTWNNMPSAGSTINLKDIGFEHQWVSFDLFSNGEWNYQADLEDGFASFLIKSDESGDERHNFYSSEEEVVGDFRPYLQVWYIPEPATIAMLTLGSIMCIKRREK